MFQAFTGHFGCKTEFLTRQSLSLNNHKVMINTVVELINNNEEFTQCFFSGLETISSLFCHHNQSDSNNLIFYVRHSHLKREKKNHSVKPLQ